MLTMLIHSQNAIESEGFDVRQVPELMCNLDNILARCLKHFFCKVRHEPIGFSLL